MKYMIASDIHGSSQWCNVMFDAFAKEGAERLVLLGDLLYHGPRNDLPDEYDPKKVIEMLNAHKKHLLCVRGNCDADVDQMVLDFPMMADYAWIPLEDGRMIFVTHGHIYHKDNMPSLQKGDIFLQGHTHIPLQEEVDGITFLNPGSVSIPKNGSFHGYMILENGKITLKKF